MAADRSRPARSGGLLPLLLIGLVAWWCSPRPFVVGSHQIDVLQTAVYNSSYLYWNFSAVLNPASCSSPYVGCAPDWQPAPSGRGGVVNFANTGSGLDTAVSGFYYPEQQRRFVLPYTALAGRPVAGTAGWAFSCWSLWAGSGTAYTPIFSTSSNGLLNAYIFGQSQQQN